MGELAKDILDGSACKVCGCYFKSPEGDIYCHEYPVVCLDCWQNLSAKEKNRHYKAVVKTF